MSDTLADDGYRQELADTLVRLPSYKDSVVIAKLVHLLMMSQPNGSRELFQQYPQLSLSNECRQ